MAPTMVPSSKSMVVNVTPVKSLTHANRYSPTPSSNNNRVKRPNLTQEIRAINLYGNVITVTVLNTEGGPGYKADVRRAVIDGTGGAEDLDFLSVVKHKTDASSSECVTVGKGGTITNFIFTCYFKNGTDEDEEIESF